MTRTGPGSDVATVPTVPTMSRRHAAGAESARGLLFTVLGEFVLPGGGAAWTSAFIEVLGRLGVEEKATRQALMRTADDGWLVSERVGRRTRWRLTPSAVQLLTEGTERIYGFTGATTDWDGRWLMVLARVPETDRPARHLLRTRLTWAGFGSPAPGVWISTHTERVDEVERLFAQTPVFDDARMFIAEHHGHRDLTAMVHQAWDLAAIDAAYVNFMTDFSSAVAPAPIERLVELVHSWRAFPWLDPNLPRSLLPPLWSGQEAAKMFATRHAIWAPDAATKWLRLNSRSSTLTRG
ncbi:MAG: phenylacetic acid degradation operon negative regulatory protein [Pseudonocardiales bacterium]|nr:phenylacetic acid degradation operon negative regulatory protein [Pseudonocardiales bacterium]